MTMMLLLLAAGTAAAQVPTITSMSPTSGPVGTSVTINGTNFSSIPSENIVWFGGVRGTVTAASATQLTVTVPAGIDHGNLKVSINNLTAILDRAFVLTQPTTGLSITATTFEPRVDIDTGPFPKDGAIGDIDGDGKLDVVVPLLQDSTISIRRNLGSALISSTGFFSPEVRISVNSVPQKLILADLDGDSRLDVIVLAGEARQDIYPSFEISHLLDLSIRARSNLKSE